ncbi:hypothetical protein [Streptomyces sp. NPDC017991]|uniref:hypothetical protein n=1 Tax=Streptomyces sp. NPDC017991 TaxID=3365026 RepID=UPI003788CB41
MVLAEADGVVVAPAAKAAHTVRTARTAGTAEADEPRESSEESRHRRPAAGSVGLDIHLMRHELQVPGLCHDD